MNNRRIEAWVGASLIILGIVFTIMNFAGNFAGKWVWAAAIASAGIPFFVAYLTARDHWWPLIPGCVLLGIAAGIVVDHSIFTPLLILGGIALPFLLIFFKDRSDWWALIPAYVMFAVMVIIVLAELNLDQWVTGWVNLAIALPFLLVYLLDRERSWALIPGGIMLLIAVIFGFTAVANPAILWGAVLIVLGVFFVLKNIRL